MKMIEVSFLSSNAPSDMSPYSMSVDTPFLTQLLYPREVNENERLQWQRSSEPIFSSRTHLFNRITPR